MTKGLDEFGRNGAEREDLQKVMSRWGTSPVPVAPSDVLEARRQRGLATLRASIGSAKRERQTRRMRFALGAAAAVALSVWAGVHFFAPGEGRQSPELAGTAHTEAHALVDGPCEVSRDRGRWVLSTPGRALAVGDRIRALDHPVSVRLDRITSARVAPGSVLAISTLAEHRQELRLVSGRADFEVDPRRAAEVVVLADKATIMVKGTVFSVTVGGTIASAWSEVAVQRGRVDIASEGQRFVIGAGEVWSSRNDSLRDVEHEGSTDGAARRPEAQVHAPSATGASGAGERMAADDGSTGHRGSNEERSGSVSDTATETAATTLSEENRLFRAALSARNSGNDGRCVALLSELMSKFPSSPLRQEAMVAQLRCLRSSGNTAAAHRTAQRYLSDYPNGFARDEARDLILDASP